jgi:REP element-mobilizing transposase RayT/DNA-binding response OmpR family regulator
MATEILVVTPQASLGEDIRRILKGGRFNVRVTGEFTDAIKLVRQTGCSLALIDSALEDIGIGVLDVGYALRQLNQEIEIVILTGGNDMPMINGLSILGTLGKPIDAASLTGLVDELFPQLPKVSATKSESESPNELPWLLDVNRAAQHLTRLTLESSAQAALITRDNQLWAYAGQLSQAAAQELSQMVERYWDWQSDGDLLRFIRLAATDQAHMLYATRLSTSMILALVFDGETPFSTIRTQSGKLARLLSASPPQEERTGLTGAHKLHPQEEPEDRIFPHIAELLQNVPPPNPIIEPPQPEPLMKNKPPASDELPLPSMKDKPTRPASDPSPAIPLQKPTVEVSPSQQVRKRQDGKPVSLDEVDPESLAQTHATAIPDDLAVTRKHIPADDTQGVIETRPQSTNRDGDSARIMVEPVSASLYNLNYACLLVPRFETHYLTGDLADRISEWVPNVCIAFGWRLEYLSIRPEYLQWIINVIPTTSPGHVMRVVRQQTSDRIFAEFVRLKKENPSNDFWAPGYLIMGGSQPHPQKLVRDFIRQTRQRQGLSGDKS